MSLTPYIQRSPASYSPQGCKAFDMTERLNAHTHTPHTSVFFRFVISSEWFVKLANIGLRSRNNLFRLFSTYNSKTQRYINTHTEGMY